ncbi:MAG: amidohydrolase family protein, partial [Candidatus Poribacteria bacterium]
LETPAERGFIFRPDGGQVGRLPNGPIKQEGVVPKLFRRYPNLYGDLSDYTACNAIARDPDYGPKFLDEFQDRLFFGTDICFFEMDIPLINLLLDWRNSKKISETVFQKIARENAIKFLGL